MVGRLRRRARSLIRSEGTSDRISGTVKRCRRIVWQGRKLRKARKGVRAIAISGLWLGSIGQLKPHGPHIK